MSKLRKARWKILKHVFENLKQVAETEGNVVLYDGDSYSDFVISIDDENMSCSFVHVFSSEHGIYYDSEQDARTSATVILERIKERVKVYKLTHIW